MPEIGLRKEINKYFSLFMFICLIDSISRIVIPFKNLNGILLFSKFVFVIRDKYKLLKF